MLQRYVVGTTVRSFLTIFTSVFFLIFEEVFWEKKKNTSGTDPHQRIRDSD